MRWINKKTSRIFDISLLPRASEAQEASLDKWESFGRTLSSSTTTLVSRWVRRSTIWLKKCTIDPLHKIQKVKTIWRRNVDFTLRNPWGRGYGTGGLTLEFAGFVLELFLWTLETFHLCTSECSALGVWFCVAQIHPAHQFLTIS